MSMPGEFTQSSDPLRNQQQRSANHQSQDGDHQNGSQLDQYEQDYEAMYGRRSDSPINHDAVNWALQKFTEFTYSDISD